ncbi:putative Endonuclease/exonuclease/phosphatase [Candidatus Methylobacter favarea]|uniref:Putative Endonuclease/exonuclease/phosphatase n=1 Tax=Candidatus Methylobacter favarea TaxID=2707345 RepID=A0A8S0WMB1_9GAMM|nr:endonuclease/exonuclease/phosphatase family protein [Candidatus Methylobacter favarea]CAA9889620.1 putative Endonuclease/exonuclease/phosphatase [Candidatus Methylobacter favarea]
MRKHELGLLSRNLFTMILALLIGFGSVAGADEYDNKRVVKVMTQNIDAGTDFIFLLDLGFDLLTAATLTYGELLQSDIPDRAALLARKIAHQQPDLISLQEVTLWQTISAGKQVTVLYDQLQLLLNSLAALNQHYTVVVSNNLTHNQLPVNPSLIGRYDDPTQVVSFTDRDVILARSDLKKSELSLSNPQAHIYDHLLSLGQLGQSVRGWISVDAKIEGKSVRFVDTHLESVYPFVPETVTIQEAQAEELIKAMDATNLPVILAGDFNADAEFAGIGPDQTDTPHKILDAGYTDTWHELHPQQHGFTWPLFLEDPLRPNPLGPFERIDLIYERNLEILKVQRLGALAHEFASDHAGVVSTMQIDNQPDKYRLENQPIGVPSPNPRNFLNPL